MSARNLARILVPACLLALAAGYVAGHYVRTPRQPAVAGAPPSPGSVLYYRNPMGLPDTSPVPKKDAMGMDYVAVRAGDAVAEGALRVTTARQQKLGVRLEPARKAILAGTLQLSGTLQLDERRLGSAAARVEGYVTSVRVAATGSYVRRGDLLLEAYSPDYLAAQQEYGVARRTFDALAGASAEARDSAARVVAAALERLRNWGMADEELAALRDGAVPQGALLLRSPRDGVVVEKPARVGQRFMPGEPLYQLADLSVVWLQADVHEQDLALVHVGAAAEAELVAWPGRRYQGHVEFLSPTLSPESRSAQARIAFANPRGEMKPGMFASVTLKSADSAPVLSIPESAVIDTGARQLAFVERSEGLFERRVLRVGRHGGGRVQVLEGLAEGERVVAEGNFLIDAESNMDAAAGSLEH